ncbi:MAG: T9SS type A sorting domain-containing protein [Bacteroidales bacterium]|jgi:hypothetical protein|nr:T9SS type A sorting domain-containing protein [Bacteroidales bacterium]
MKTKLLFVVLISLLLSWTQSVKADTIHITLTVPSQIQNLCQDPMNFDTFIIHKYQYFAGVPTWYVDGLPVAVCDSFVYVPTSSVSVLITAIWNYNEYGVRLSLYTSPPAHTTFSVLSGGNLSTSGDTVWMCDDSVRVGSNASGSQMTSWHWGNTAGLYSVDAPLYITTPGTYFFYMENPCGITIDTFEVIQLPTSAPVWTDIAFCNQPVSMTLDAGAGWSYLWSTGATTQTIDVSSVGTYMVSLTNHCVSSTSASIDITQYFYPQPAFDTIPILCNNLQQIINPNDTFVYDTYLWSTGETTPSITVTAPSATYYVTVTKGGCSAIAGTDMYFYPDPEAPVQCVSTFDPLSGKNATVIEADADESELIGYVLCYKQGSSWIPLDTIASGALPSYTLYDDLHDPNQQSFTYAAFALHSCGNLSPIGDWHKTIRIAIFQDVISSDYVLQIMDDYETMGGYTPDSYTIWIDSLNDGNLSEIGILNGGNSSFTISTPVNGAAYYASVNLPWTCNTTKSANVSFSNKRVFSTSSVSENTLQTLSIYPNPATNQITISGIETGGMLRLYDLSGKLLLERVNRDNTLEIVGIAAGSYVLEIRAGAESGSEVLRGRVVVE